MSRGGSGPKNVYFIKPIGLDGPIKIGFSELVRMREGFLSCKEHCRSALMRRVKSNAKFGMALTKSSAQAVLQWLQGLYGPSRPQRISQALPAGMSARRPGGYPANSNLPASSSLPSSPKLRGETENRAF
jgi:hypothetical protein